MLNSQESIMKKFPCITYLLLMILFILIGCAGNAHKHQEFNTIKTEITSIAIMPPDIEYFERNPVVTRPNTFYIKDISHNIVEAIQNGFTDNAIEVHPIFASGSELDQDLTSSLIEVMQSYKESCESFHSSGGKILNMVLNPRAKQFAITAKTNFLLFVRGKGYGRLSGENRSDVVYSGMLGTASQWDGLMLDMALFDANIGEIIWFNYNKEYQSQYQPLVPESVQELCNLLLKDLIKLGEPEAENTAGK
jgi:PBP1b-binding outer membrane lipoprotein LpoB